ncbi:MAG: tetratricopeptide repeat protein [Myxococcales bacterium]
MTELDDDKATRRAQRREKQTTNDAPTEVAEVKNLERDAEQAPSEKRVDQIRDRNARLRAQAAEERRAKRDREKAVVAVPVGLDASERMDDIFVRTTHAATVWLRGNFKWLQWVAIVGIAGGLGLQGYRYSSKSKAAKSTDALAVGLVAEGGTIRPASSDESKSLSPELEELDPRPVYDSESAKLAAAEQGYRKAMSSYGKSGAGWLARLGLAGVLYDQQKWDEALDHYRAVRASEIAKKDPDVLGRCLEGIGLSLEGKGDREGALQAFREMTNQEGAPTLATLGLYHQARILLAQGQKDKAKELLTKAKERVDKAAKEGAKGEVGPQRQGYIGESVKMLMARIDPAAARAASADAITDTLQNDPAKLQRMLQDLQNQPAAPGGEQ